MFQVPRQILHFGIIIISQNEVSKVSKFNVLFYGVIGTDLSTILHFACISPFLSCIFSELKVTPETY